MGDQALKTAQTRAAHFRELARRDPLTYEPELGLALYALCQTMMTRPAPVTQTFLDLCEEGIALHRRLLHTNRPSLPQLGILLGWLGHAQCSVGSYEKGRPLLEESVGLMQRLSRQDPKGYEPNVCRVLSLAGHALAESGNRRAALDAAGDAVARWRRLTEKLPGVHDVDLALALHALCFVLQSTGDQRAMLAPAEESVSVMRRLHAGSAASGSTAALLAGGLDLVAAALVAHQRWSDAAPVAEEAIALRKQAQKYGERSRSLSLATSLGNYSKILGQTGRRSEAKLYASDAYAECVRRVFDTNDLAGLASAAADIGALISEHGMKWSAILLRRAVAKRLQPRPQRLRGFLRR